MSASPCIRCLLFTVLAVGLRAEEKSPPQAPLPAEDVIAVARRDYDVIKDSRASLEQQRLNLPKVSTPTMPPTPMETSTMPEMNQSLKKAGQLSKHGKSANWLLEAMNENDKDKNENGRKAQSFDEMKAELFPGEKDQEKLLTPDKDPLRRDDPKLQASTRKLAESADNPLTSYMSSWMTPHDFELLKVKSPEPGLAVSTEKTLERPVAGELYNGLMRMENPMGAGRMAAAPAELRPNPYLADFTLGVPSAGVRELMAMPAPNMPGYLPPASAIPPPPKSDSAPAKNQPNPIDLLKSQDDAKYFPQLKRF